MSFATCAAWLYPFDEVTAIDYGPRLPREGAMRFPTTPTFLLLVTWLAFALCAWAQQKPLTQDQVQSLIRSGLGGESGAKAIEQSEIDFVPAEDFRQSLKAAGAREAFLQALRTAKLPEGLRASERGVVT